MTMLPAHFAATEAAVVIAGAFAMARTARINAWWCVGIAPFMLAALVGTIRISAGLAGDMELLHQLLSRAGALFGLGCMVGVMMGRPAWLPPLLGLAAGALAMLIPGAQVPAFAALFLTGSVLAYRSARGGAGVAASFAVLLIGRLGTDVLRAAHPGFAWHGFHLAVALWLILVAHQVAPAFRAR
jgi:hypothetical protein